MEYDNQFKTKIIIIRSTNKAKHNAFSLTTKINYNIQNRLLLTKTFYSFHNTMQSQIFSIKYSEYTYTVHSIYIYTQM